MSASIFILYWYISWYLWLLARIFHNLFCDDPCVVILQIFCYSGVDLYFAKSNVFCNAFVVCA